MSITLAVKPAKEPITLAMAKEHLRIIDNDSDSYISTLIFVARRTAEAYLNRALITQTWDYYIDAFASVIKIPKGKLQSVTYVKYTDTDGALQTVNSSPLEYTVDTDSDPGYVRRAYGQTWPNTRNVSGAVTIRFVCGYGDSQEDVPEDIRHGILMIIADLYEHRETATPAYEAILHPHRLIE